MPKGVARRTPENMALAVRLRDEGLLLREIAERIGGVTVKAVSEWLADPDQEKYRARRARYAVDCSVCGAPIANGSKEADPDEPVCHSCVPAHYAIWTEDAIVLAIQEWADDHGGIPPTADDFVRDKRNGADLPSVNQAIARFGRWNAAIVAAGFEPHRSGPVGGLSRLSPRQRALCATRYAAGESSVDIAADYGCSPQTVIKWVRHAGVPIRPSFIDTRRAA